MDSADNRSETPALIAIVGATGTGKSRLSLQIAELLNRKGRIAEVVNADAMQLYRGMDIGTAKLPPAERDGVPHHLIDVLDVTDDASVASYQSDALAVIDDIRSRGAVPIMVGGSGLYVSSVLFDFRFPGTDAAVRERLEAELAESGPGILHARLRELDPGAAASIGPFNGRRMVRALEVIEITGEPFGSGLPDEDALRTPTRIFGMTEQRATLVDRLDRRVEQMWADGLLDEVQRLLPLGLSTASTAGRAIGQTQALTRKYARRQVGWFRRYPDVVWLESGDPAAAQSALATMTA